MKQLTAKDVRRIVRDELDKVFEKRTPLIGFRATFDDFNPDEYFGKIRRSADAELKQENS